MGRVKEQSGQCRSSLKYGVISVKTFKEVRELTRLLCVTEAGISSVRGLRQEEPP